MKTLFSIIIILVATAAGAAPWLVCDPQAGVQFYKITGWATPTQPAEADGSIKLDIAAAPVGTTPMTFKACVTDVWGEQCSDATPFDLTRPARPAKSTNIRLSP